MFDLVRYDAGMILVGAVLFVVFWKALEKSLFGPYLKLIEQREAATSGAEQTAQEKIAKSDDLNRQYDSKLLEQRVTFMQAKLAALDRAKSEADQITGSASKAAQEKLSALRQEISAKVSQIKASSEREADALTEIIVQKVAAPSSGRSTEQR